LEQKLLRIYLNDHRAGAIAGFELGKRTLARNRGGEPGTILESLVREIREDLLSLEDIMRRLQVPLNRIKARAAWTAEKVGRLKLNGRVRGYSPLSRLVELEALTLGVEGKRRLWQSLLELAAHEPRLDPAELERLRSRAEDQLGRLEGARLKAAADAFFPERSRT
jgi:hypothetical protein